MRLQYRPTANVFFEFFPCCFNMRRRQENFICCEVCHSEVI